MKNCRCIRLWKNKKGTTLVELIVTVALIGLFAAGSVKILTSAMEIYQRIQSLRYGLQVSELLMDEAADAVRRGNAELLVDEDGRLTVQYDGASKKEDWMLAEEFYHEYRITELNVRPASEAEPGAYGEDVMKVRMKLEHSIYGEYSVLRYVRKKN